MLQVSPPRVNMDAPLQLLCTNLDYDEHKGRIAIGRITSGRINKAENVIVCRPGAWRGLRATGSCIELKYALYPVWLEAV